MSLINLTMYQCLETRHLLQSAMSMLRFHGCMMERAEHLELEMTNALFVMYMAWKRCQ